MYNDDGYVEDSEGEESMVLDPLQPLFYVPAPGLLPPPPLPFPARAEYNTFSSIQTANFTDRSMVAHHTLQARENPQNTTVYAASTIQTAETTIDRLKVSDISSFGVGNSSVQAESSISTSTSAQPPTKTKPRPRPVFKRKDPTSANPFISDGTPSSVIPSSGGTPFPYLHSMPPLLPPLQQHVASSPRSLPPTATTVLATDIGTQRASDSGVEMVDVGMMDIAERAKLRSRARSQAKGKQVAVIDDVIELSSSEDELSFIPSSKAKAKAKPKKLAASKQSASEKSLAKDKSRTKGSGRDLGKPSPPKRAKTAQVLESGFESDVNTIPVPTSDFPLPQPLPPHLQHPSSQLPPSDPPPPPSTSGSSSAQSVFQTSQSHGAADGQREESPLSSPPPPMPRKRKRPLPRSAVNGEDFDPGADKDSFVAGAGDDEPAQMALGQRPPPGASPDVVPETQPAAPPKAKPSARRKRKDVDEEEWGGEPPEKPARSRKKARTEEEDEEEWAGDGPSKAKPKGKKGTKKAATKEKVPKEKTTKKAKAGAKSKSATSKEMVEVSAEEAAEDKDRQVMPPPPDPVPTSKGNDKVSVPSNNDTVATGPAKVPSKDKGKQRAVVLSDDEDNDDANAADVSTNAITTELDSPAPAAQKKAGRKSTGVEKGSKENDAPTTSSRPASSSPTRSAPAKPAATRTPARTSFAQANRTYTIGSNKSTPMSELIRRVSSLPGSPFPATSRPTYSPLAKASKLALRRIAPLHPNRRTPPPPPPKAPPKPKSKKMLELEEKWELELEESVEGWYAMSEEERMQLRRAKRDHELGFED